MKDRLEWNSICLIIVIYNKFLFDTETYHTLISKYVIDGYKLGLFIWDNTLKALHNPLEFVNGCYYKHTGKNEGVSKAYNEGALYSKNNNFDWILLLDQDTFFPDNIIEEYQKSINENPSIKIFTLVTKEKNGKYISPCLFKHKISIKKKKRPPIGLLNIFNYSIINSGMLIKTETFFKVGGYNEKVWLDFSDHEFINRFKKYYNMIYVIDKESLQSFSCVEETDYNNILNRYKILCECIKNCPKHTLQDKIEYILILFKRICSLIIKTKKISYFNVFLRYFD
jgi:hypothetical protein